MSANGKSPVRCDLCSKALDTSAIVIGDKFLHPACFRCPKCNNPLKDEYYEFEGKPHCLKCYGLANHMICHGCDKSTLNQEIVRMCDCDFHVACACCKSCKTSFIKGKDESSFFYVFENEPHCLSCAATRLAFSGGDLARSSANESKSVW